jgi:hypothetical protein
MIHQKKNIPRDCGSFILDENGERVPNPNDEAMRERYNLFKVIDSKDIKKRKKGKKGEIKNES